MDTRLLILNADPVFQDEALALLDSFDGVETHIVRSLPEAIAILIRESFDLFVIENELVLAVEQAVEARHHFPSLAILCLTETTATDEIRAQACQQKISLVSAELTPRQLRRELRGAIAAHRHAGGVAAEGVDPCHSLVGNLNQFSAAEVLQMSCLSQRSGRFTFKSARGNGEIFLHHGMVRHATYGSLEGELAVAEVFRWRQGRFYFEEGIISQVQTVDRPWAHLLIDNLQKLDETLEKVGTDGR